MLIPLYTKIISTIKQNALLFSYIGLFFTLLIWGGNFYVAQSVTALIDDATVTSCLRFIAASLILLVIIKIRTGKFFQTYSLQQWLIILIASVFGIVIYNLLFFFISRSMQPAVIAMIFALSPTISLILSTILFKMKIKFFGVLGIIIAFLSVIQVIYHSRHDCQDITHIFADFSVYELLAIFATFSFSVWSIANKYASNHRIDSVVITTYSVVSGTVILIVIALFQGKAPLIIYAISSHYNDFNFWFGISYMGILSTAICGVLYASAIKRIGVNEVSICQNLVVVFAVLIGIVIYNQKVNYELLIAGFFVLLGVVITNLSSIRTKLSFLKNKYAK